MNPIVYYDCGCGCGECGETIRKAESDLSHCREIISVWSPLLDRAEKVERAARVLLAALGDYWLWNGIEHEADGCPEDDTCDCPIVQRYVNADDALRTALAADEGVGDAGTIRQMHEDSLRAVREVALERDEYRRILRAMLDSITLNGYVAEGFLSEVAARTALAPRSERREGEP